MAGKEENRKFVGGSSHDVTERQLEHAFSPFGKILDSQIIGPLLSVAPSWMLIASVIALSSSLLIIRAYYPKMLWLLAKPAFRFILLTDGMRI